MENKEFVQSIKEAESELRNKNSSKNSSFMSDSFKNSTPKTLKMNLDQAISVKQCLIMSHIRQ